MWEACACALCVCGYVCVSCVGGCCCELARRSPFCLWLYIISIFVFFWPLWTGINGQVGTEWGVDERLCRAKREEGEEEEETCIVRDGRGVRRVWQVAGQRRQSVPCMHQPHATVIPPNALQTEEEEEVEEAPRARQGWPGLVWPGLVWSRSGEGNRPKGRAGKKKKGKPRDRSGEEGEGGDIGRKKGGGWGRG